MKEHPRTEAKVRDHAVPAFGSITRQMVYDRTLELALIAGRISCRVNQVDYEQAKRELTGESDSIRQQRILDFPEY